MKETIETFFSQHEAAIVDFSFIAGYILFIIAVTILVLFFGLRYIRRHQKPGEKTVKGFTKQSLFDMLDHFMFTFFFYAGHVMGIRTGLHEEFAPLFDVLPPFLYTLTFIPILLIIFFVSQFIYNKFFDNKLNNWKLRYSERGDIYADTESSSIPDIPDRDTSGGTPDRPLHHDRHCP